MPWWFLHSTIAPATSANNQMTNRQVRMHNDWETYAQWTPVLEMRRLLPLWWRTAPHLHRQLWGIPVKLWPRWTPQEYQLPPSKHCNRNMYWTSQHTTALKASVKSSRSMPRTLTPSQQISIANERRQPLTYATAKGRMDSSPHELPNAAYCKQLAVALLSTPLLMWFHTNTAYSLR